MKLNYKVLGDGSKTLLFLHGWGCDHEVFNNLIGDLKYDYRVINLDLMGFGKSELDERISDIYSYALELYLFLKQNNFEKITIIAHAFGGRLALILASLFDIKIENLILIGCAGIRPKRSLVYYAKVYKYKFLKKLKQIGFKNIDLDKYGSSDYKDLSKEMKALFVNVVNQDLTWLLKYIANKTIIIFGEKDKQTPIYMAKNLHKKISDSELHILKNCGHFCFVEEDRKVLNIVKNSV